MSTLNTITTNTSSTTHFDGKLAVGDYDPYMSLDSALPGPQTTSQTLPVPYSKDAKPSTIEQEPTFLPSPSYLPPPPLPPPSNSNENNPSWYHGSKNTETTIPENELDSSFNNTSVAVNESSSSNAASNPAWYHGDNTLTSLKDGIVSGPDTAFGSRIQRERTNSQENRELIRVQNDSEPEITIREVSSRTEHVPKRSSVNMSDEPTVTITSVTIEKRNENGDVMKAKVIENGERLDGGRFDEELWEQDITSPDTRYDTGKTEVFKEKIDQSDKDEEEKLSHSGKKVKKVDQEKSSKRGSKKVETKKKTEKDSDDSVEENDDDDEEEGKKEKVVKSKETRKEDDDGGKKVVKKTEKKKTKDSDDDSEISSDTDDSEISNDSDSDEEKPKKKKKVVKEEGTEKTKVEKKSSAGSASKKSAGGAKTTEKKETSVTTKPAGAATDSSSVPKKDYPPLTGSDDEASTSDNEDKGKREKLKEKVKECIIS